MRRLVLHNRDVVVAELKHIGVDPEAYPIFVEKAYYNAIRLDGLSCAQANVVKQIALSCGADAAVPRTVYHSGTRKKIPVIVFANDRELQKMMTRLNEQVWLQKVTEQINGALVVRNRVPFLKLGSRKILFDRTYIMGVINITPDSFYDGSRCMDEDTVRRIAAAMEEEGADFIDIGAESSRPGATPTVLEEEKNRLRKIVPAVIRTVRVPVSIDTCKSDTAAFAIDHGVKIVNDISGLRFDEKMVGVLARHRVGLIIMHMQGSPRTMQSKPRYDNLMGDINRFLSKQLVYAIGNGIDSARIVIDPGLGFGKKTEDNYEIINRLGELAVHNRPILVGHSRKSFIGKPFNIGPEHRLEGTLGVESLLIRNGASIIRVHDVSEARKVAQLVDVIVR